MFHFLSKRTFRASLCLLSVSTFAGCAASASRAFLNDEDVARLTSDTKATCLVAGQIESMGLGKLQGGVKLATTGGELVTASGEGSLLTGDGFAFVNVPKGAFRVTYLNFFHHTTGGGVLVNEFDTKGEGKNVINNHGVGAVPNEMSGTCNGGFIWLGVFKGDPGGLMSEPELELGSDAISAGYALRDLKAKLAGTAWESEVSDSPADNTPLAEGQAVVEIVDPAKAAAAKAAAQAAATAAVAKKMAESRPVTLPTSDAGALTAVAGTYVLEAINGKPVPYTFEANKCIMVDAKYELKADGAYTTAANMECAGAKYAFPTSGLFGVVGGKVTFAVGVGPTPAAGVTKIDGAKLTTVAAPDTYTYKKN